jgi:hypothetical protein
MDEAPGDTNGQGVINAWWVVKADGSLDKTMPAASGGTTATTEDSGGGTGY